MNLFTLSIKTFLYSLYKILSKNQSTSLKKVKYIDKLIEIKAKSKSFVKNVSFSFENKSIKSLWILKNNILYHTNFK